MSIKNFSLCAPEPDQHGNRSRISQAHWGWFLLIAGMPAAHSADAQNTEPNALVVANVRSLDRYQAEQERLKKMQEGKPQAYEDKVMDPSLLPAMTEGETLPDGDQLGFRGYLLETRFGTARSDSGFERRSAGEFGLRAEFRRETLNYGDLTGQIDVRNSTGEEGFGLGPFGFAREKSSTRGTLRNIGLPITTKMFADTSLGDISSEVTDALARAYRLSLGSSIVRGISTRVFDGDFDLRAGTGSRGNLAGGPYPGFERSQGTLSWAGYSRRLPGESYTGLQVNRATAVPAFHSPFSSQSTDVSSMAASVGHGKDLYTSGSHKIRLIYVRSRESGAIASVPRNAEGYFLEGGFRAMAYRHELGAYSADQQLRFGDYALAGDNRGAYWRVDTSGLRLAWGAGVDVEDQNPGHGPGRQASRRASLSINAQYRLNRNDSLGANAQLARTRNDHSNGEFLASGDGTRSLNASAYYQTRFADWGRSRFRVTVRRHEQLVINDLPATGEELEWEQDWIRGRYETMRPELMTTLGVARDRSNGIRETQPTAGLVFRLWPDADWSIGGSLRYTSRTGNLATSRGLSGTLETEKVLSGGWRIGALVNLNQAVVNMNANANAFSAPQITRSNEKSAYVYVRWEGSSGTTYQGAGLREPGTAGGGSVDGFIFFDGNRDGEQQPGESGVPNVEVFLDGRFRVTTDRNGRFEFPLVATGSHHLSLTLETVPLPWGTASENRVKVDVPLRGQATVRIPVVWVGD